jgi:copper chaperone CopZ
MIALLFSSCRVQDVRNVVIKTPGLKNPACAKVIQDAFMRQPGIINVSPDFQKHEVTVKYNSMVIAIKNIEFTIAEAGFDANYEKARTNAVAALPAECK